MNGTDELIVILDWIMGELANSPPEVVANAVKLLKQRQEQSIPFDIPQNADGNAD